MWDVYFYFCLLLLNTVLWLSRYGQLSPEMRILGFAVLATLLFEGYAAYLMLRMTRNLHVFHLLTPVEYLLYTLVFYRAFHSATHRRVALGSIPLYLLASLLVTLFLQKPGEFNSYTSSINNVLLPCWVLLYYHEVFTGLSVVRLSREPMFWVSTGLLFYSLGSFFLYGLMNSLLGLSYEVTHALYYFGEFLGYVLHVTFLIGFLHSRKKPLQFAYKS